MKTLLKNPLFILGVLLRLTLLSVVFPNAASIWFVPFLQNSILQPGFDPWHTFIASGGTVLAFPYGYVMWIVLLPLSIIVHLIGINPYWGYGLTIMLFDFGLFIILKRLITVSDKMLLWSYWLSPIILFASYWIGMNDIIPVFFIFLALLNLKKLQIIQAGVICGLAISAKLSMILAIPLFVIYLFRNKALRHLLPAFSISLVLTVTLLGLPFLFSKDAMHMLFTNPEMLKIYDFSVKGSSGTMLYILPMVYLLTIYLAWYIRRINYDLFFVLLGISFFLVLIMTPAAPGWFIWVMPLLVFYQSISGRIAFFLVGGFAAIYLLTSFLTTVSPAIFGSTMTEQFRLLISNALGDRGIGLLHTLLLTFGVILVIRMWRETFRKNDFFRISRRPLVIGIAGDSGSGKHTLVNSVIAMFGQHSVVTLSGDDYHLWDRQKPMWDVITHLNPRANDLEQYAQDLINLTDGKSIRSRHYDHSSGRKSRINITKSNDFIIASGLHALYLPILRGCYNLSIFLDIDEELRTYFKIQRDVHERGHSLEGVMSSIDKRVMDGLKFIKPQAMYADLVLSLQPIRQLNLINSDTKTPPRLKLIAKARHGHFEESLIKVLIGICGLQVDVNIERDNAEVELTIEGETSAEDIALAVHSLLPEMEELLDINPKWEDGVKGLLQLLVLTHIKQTLRRRLI